MLHLSKPVLLPVALVLLVLAAGCSGQSDESPRPTTSLQSELPPTTDSAPALVGGSGSIDPDGPPATTPDGKLIGPVSTRDVSGGSTSIYRGIVGRLGPQEQVVPPVAEPPSSAPGVLPLTGIFSPVPERSAAVVKLDNVAEARRQTGLDRADIVFEEEVEAGFTRLAAVFHSQSSYVGPVRSGRTTDIGVLGCFGNPLFIYSGANVATDSLIRSKSNVQNHSFDTTSGFWRDKDRRAPANLFSHTSPHWASAEGGPPPQQFFFRKPGQRATGTALDSFSVSYRRNKVDWAWDGSRWRRNQGGQPHITTAGDQITAANIIVVEVDKVDTGMVDGSGSRVPEFVYVGTGSASVFTGGTRTDGVWTRPTVSSVATFTRSDGSAIELGRGKTWIEVVGSASQVG